MPRTTLATLVVSMLILGTLVGPAAAAKRPSKAQAAAITRAVRAAPLGGAGALPRSWYTVDRIRISSLSASWAIAWQRATHRGEGRFQPAYFILVQPQDSTARPWAVVSLGTAMVGCGVAPDVVLKDLTGAGCPPGEGIRGS
jgi:hypothetical protein